MDKKMKEDIINNIDIPLIKTMYIKTDDEESTIKSIKKVIGISDHVCQVAKKRKERKDKEGNIIKMDEIVRSDDIHIFMFTTTSGIYTLYSSIYKEDNKKMKIGEMLGMIESLKNGLYYEINNNKSISSRYESKTRKQSDIIKDSSNRKQSIVNSRIEMGTTLKFIFILPDFDSLFNDYSIKRKIKDILNLSESVKDESGNSFTEIKLIVLGNKDKKNLLYEYDSIIEDKDVYVSKDLVEKVSNKISLIPEIKEENIGKDKIEKEIVSLIGKPVKDMKNIMDKSFLNKKNMMLNRSIAKEISCRYNDDAALLSVEPTTSFEEIGGNDNFKIWIGQIKKILSLSKEKKEEYGIEHPKGYIAIGPPGTGKTMIAEAVAKELDCDLFYFDPTKVMSSLVGDSEKNIDMILNTIKDKQCVLVIDEVEKILGGVSSSNSSDAGTTSRVFARILTFLADKKKKPFVIMTSNDISSLPPELMRSGRLDKIWYFELPNAFESVEIFNNILKVKKRKANIAELESGGFFDKKLTGAEMYNVVNQSIYDVLCDEKYESYKKEKILPSSVLINKSNKVSSVAKYGERDIKFIEYYCKQNGVETASSKEKKALNYKYESVNDI